MNYPLVSGITVALRAIVSRLISPISKRLMIGWISVGMLLLGLAYFAR